MSYTEGRRTQKTYLFSNPNYRVIHTCSERYRNGILGTQGMAYMWFEIVMNSSLLWSDALFLYSAEGSKRPRDWFSYLEAFITYMNLKTFAKIGHLFEDLRPVTSILADVCPADERRFLPEPIPMSATLEGLHKLRTDFELIFRGRPSRTNRTDTELSTILHKFCMNFDDNEMVDLDIQRVRFEA